jgi:dihydroorotate dehydrogenase (fumarate)
LIEQAGADALELNVYFVPTDARLSGERLEESTLELVQQVRSSINIPLAVIARPLISRDGEGEALRLPLRWIALLHGRVSADLAATGWVHAVEDVVKLLMVGAHVTMLDSTLLTPTASAPITSGPWVRTSNRPGPACSPEGASATSTIY